MNIELKEITVRELSEGYQDNDENGVVGYSGKLDIRPPIKENSFIKINKEMLLLIQLLKTFLLMLCTGL